MSKMRIILADTEKQVVSALETKFLYELRDDVDLEVITDTTFFSAFFSKPQTADILVCGEELFTQDIKKHSIKKLFLLCEQAGTGGTEDLSVERVLKYSSPQAVMDQVLRGHGTQKKREPVVVLVYSAAGGVGKTTVALGICANLAKSYKRVLYLNAERIHTFQSCLQEQQTLSNQAVADIAGAGDHPFAKMRPLLRNEGFDYLPPFPVALASAGLSFRLFAALASAAKRSGEYDYVVVDTDTVFDGDKASLITQADRVLMVLRQTKRDVFAMNMLVRNMSCSDATKYFFVCNDFDKDADNALLSQEKEPKFYVSEYLPHIDHVQDLTVGELGTRSDMQKVAFLVM